MKCPLRRRARMADFASLLQSGDVDSLRLHLRSTLDASSNNIHPPPDDGDDDEDDSNPAVEALASKGIAIADDLLRRGLPHLERAAAGNESNNATVVSTSSFSALGLTLREHAVMGQNVWPAALALGSWLASRGESVCRGARVIELGAGAAAPGLVARLHGAAHLLATDGDESLVPLMTANCEGNPGGSWAASRLDWREGVTNHEPGTWDVVLAADVLYAAGDILPLVTAASALLRKDESSKGRFVLASSAWFRDLQPTLVASAEEVGLVLSNEEQVATEGEAPASASSEGPVILEFVRTT